MAKSSKASFSTNDIRKDIFEKAETKTVIQYPLVIDLERKVLLPSTIYGLAWRDEQEVALNLHFCSASIVIMVTEL